VRLLKVTALRAVVVACLSAGAVAWAAGPALADGTDPAYPGSVVHVMASGPLTPNSIMTITATGANVAPMSVYGISTFEFGLSLFLVSADVLPAPCATTRGVEGFIALNNAQYVHDLTPAVLLEGFSGPFTISVPVTLNSGTGHLMVCAYSVYGDIDDAAWASTEVTIEPAGGSQVAGAKPAATRRPRVTRSGGRLLCSRGSWSQSPASYRYRWLVLHRTGTVGRGPSLVVGHAVRGRTVECSVTAKNSSGSATATSVPFRVS
jgi:hypothetical protein